MKDAVYTYVPYSGYPQELPAASGQPMTVMLDACAPDAFRRLWGMTLLERNLRLVERLGARAVHVFVREEDRRKAEKRRFPALTTPVFHAVDGSPLAAMLDLVDQTDGPVLLLEAVGLYDRRFVAQLWQTAAPALGTQRGEALAAAALLVDARVDAPESALRDWTTFAEYCLQHSGATRVDLAAVENRVSLLRKSVLPRVIRVGDRAALKRADAYLRELAGKGVNDIIGEYIHPPIEFFLTRLAAYTPLTPNLLSYFIILLSLAGLYFFAAGRLWEGIAVNLVRGVVDGVDGKLARLTLRESRYGNLLDHGTDTVYLPLLFLSLGYALSNGDPLSGPALATYGLQICYWFNRVFSSWFRLFLGVDESEFRPIDRLVRRFQPKRNIFILILIIAMFFQAPVWGLYGITALTGFFLCYRVARLDYEGRRLQREARKEKSAGSAGTPA